MQKIKKICALSVFCLTVCASFNVQAYCYGVQLGLNITSTPSGAGDYFNGFKQDTTITFPPDSTSPYYEWSNTNQNSPREVYYLSVPKSIKLSSGQLVSVTVANPGNTTTETAKGYMSVPVGYLPNASCSVTPEGKYETGGRFVASTSTVTVTGVGLPAGIYTASIPFYYTYSDEATAATMFANFGALVGQGEAGNIALTLNVTNNCSVSSQSVALNFGTVTPGELNNKTVASPLTVSCKNTPVSMTFTLKSTDGTIGSTPCGNGTCSLSLTDSSGNMLSNSVTLNNNTNTFNVNATYQNGVSAPQPGTLSGSGILQLQIN